MLYGGPALLGLAVLVWRGCVSRPRLPNDPAQLFIVLSTMGLGIVMLLMIVIGGLLYETRYTYPIYGLSLLALLSVIRIEPHALRTYANVTLAVWIAFVAGTLVYSQIVIHRIFRDPAPAAAAALRDLWDRQFFCGPSYLLGTDRAARGIAIYFDRPILGVAFDEVGRTNWFDQDRLERLGAVVVSTADQPIEPQYAQWFAGKPVATLTLPYRRARQAAEQSLQYYFIPPHGCNTNLHGP